MWTFGMGSGPNVAGRNFYRIINFYRPKILKVRCVIDLPSFSQHPYSKSLNSHAIWSQCILAYFGIDPYFPMAAPYFFKKVAKISLTSNGLKIKGFRDTMLGKRGEIDDDLNFFQKIFWTGRDKSAGYINQIMIYRPKFGLDKPTMAYSLKYWPESLDILFLKSMDLHLVALFFPAS